MIVRWEVFDLGDVEWHSFDVDDHVRSLSISKQHDVSWMLQLKCAEAQLPGFALHAMHCASC